MRPSQMGRPTRGDFHLDEPLPFIVTPRGKGGRLAAVPLVEEGLEAAHAFIGAEAFGPWSCPSANKALGRAAARAGRPPFTVPDSALVLGGIAPDQGRRRRPPVPLRAHRPGDHRDLRATTLAKHREAIERLRGGNDAPTRPHQQVRRPIGDEERSNRLADAAGSRRENTDKSFVPNG